jgi:tetratricopeptide (TPR) repeat protein
MDAVTREKLKLAQRFKKENKTDEAEDIYREYWQTNPEDFSEFDKTTFCWILYNKYIKNNEDVDEILENAELITEIKSQQDQSQNSKYPCPYTLAVLKTLEILNKNNDFEEVTIWAEKINPDWLNPNASDFNGRKYPSNKEKYYSQLTKALLKLDDIDRCYELSKEALELEDLADDTWFKWRLAKCANELGEYDEAIGYLKEIISKKPDWYIKAEIANSYFFNGDNESSLSYAIDAVLTPAPSESKVNVYSLIADLVEDEYPEEALKHRYLEYSIRLNKEWKIDDRLAEEIEETGLDAENTQYWKIEKELKPFWNEMRYKGQDLKYGIISKILPNGKVGFIEGDDGGSYFFAKHDFNGKNEDFKEFTSVSFYTEERLDKKKGVMKPNAVNINTI